MPESCEVRRIDRGNREGFLGLIAAFTEEVLPEKDSAGVRAAYRAWMEDEETGASLCGFLLYSEGRPVGCAQLFCYRPPPMLDTGAFGEAEVMNVYVVPSERRKGFGQVLMDSVIAEARARNVRHLRLNSSPAAERLYEKNGFTRPAFTSYGRWLKA
jgi:GNAT superfamily N-acetyltransferase